MTQFRIENGILLGCENADPEIVIPDSVVTIGGDAFRSNEDIVKVVFPESVRIISQNAFSFCKCLREVELPSSLFFIGDGAFSFCESLERVSLPDSIVYLGDSAFLNCENMTSVKLPRYLQKLERAVLCGCERLPHVDIPKTIRVIDENAFTRCKSFTAVDIPFGVEVIGSSAFAQCSSLRYVIIPDSVHIIESMAFYHCDDLESVRLPSTVFQIDQDAFPNSTRYSMRRFGFIEECEPADIRLSPRPIPQSEIMQARASGFDINNHGVLVRYTGSESIVSIPGFVRSVFDEAFYNNPTVVEVAIPQSVEYLGRHVFAHCNNLRKVMFECEKPRLRHKIFDHCPSLESVVLPNGIDEIPDSMFWGCSSLKSVNMPEKLKVIGENAFFECSTLGSVQLPESLLCINLQAFDRCSGLLTVDLPDSICHLGYRAFDGCSKLMMASMPSRAFLPKNHLSPFGEGVDVRLFESQWHPEDLPVEPSPEYRHELIAEFDSSRSYGESSPSGDDVHEYSLLMKTIAFVAQATSSSYELSHRFGVPELERALSDVEYNLDACGQTLFAILTSKGIPFLQTGRYALPASEHDAPISYGEYKAAFANSASIPYDSQIGDVINLLDTHLGKLFQEAVKAYQYALLQDVESIHAFKGGGYYGNGIIYNIAFSKSHLGSVYYSLVYPTRLVLLPDSGPEFHDAEPFALSEMDFNETTTCMMPGDITRLFNMDTRECSIEEHMHVQIVNMDCTAIKTGSRELDDYFDKSIRFWLDKAY